MLIKIHHLGLVVHSADQALEFWRDAVGLPVTADRVIEDQGVRGVLLGIGGSEIELLEPTREDTGVARYLESRGEGAHHLCFESDDVAAELRRAASLGLDMIDEAPRPGLAGMIGFVHPKASHGVLVEYATPIEPPHHAPAPSGPVAASHIDHIVVGSTDAAATAAAFVRNHGIEIKRVMSRPGTGAHMEFAKLQEVVLEFAGPGTPTPADEVRARLGGTVLAVPDMERAYTHLKSLGVDIEEPHPAVQPTAVIAGIKSGTSGVPFALIQYGARPSDQP